MSEIGLLRAPGHTLVGRGTRAHLGSEVALHGSRVLFITDPGVAGLAEEAIQNIRAAGVIVTVFDQVSPEFDYAEVDSVAAAYVESASEAVVGFGGGSCLDMAKLVAVKVTHGGDLRRFIGEGLVPGAVVPIIAVPTTAGTGSEVTPIAVATDAERGVKAGISSRYIVPCSAIVDPALTDGCPASVSAASGIDALTHAIESFTAARRTAVIESLPKGFVGKNLISDLLAQQAITLIVENLGDCVRNPNSDVRDRMAYGSFLSGLSFGQAGTGLAHALQYPVGLRTHTSHGLGVGILLPYVMEFTRHVRRQEFAEIARALGLEDSCTPAGISMVTERVIELRNQIGIPHTLAEIGVRNEEAASIAEAAFGIKRLVANNGRTASQDDLEAIVRAAIAGDFSLIPADQ